MWCSTQLPGFLVAIFYWRCLISNICLECGNPIPASDERLEYPGVSVICHECHFWLEKVNFNDQQKARQVIVNGGHFMLSENTGPFRGFGGAEFAVCFNDGRAVVHSNMWSQGEIPESFRDRLPDNAFFLSGE